MGGGDGDFEEEKMGIGWLHICRIESSCVELSRVEESMIKPLASSCSSSAL